MRSKTSICVLLALSGVLGCGSRDDRGPASTAGQPGAAAGSANAGALSDGGRLNIAGDGGHAGALATGGTTTTGGTTGNETGGAGADGPGVGGAGAGGSAGNGGAATACQLPLTTGDHSHLVAMERVETYSVSGTTAQQLRQSINANRGHDYDALTTWNITWNYQNCSSPVWTITLDIVYDLPKWDAPPSANAALVASWNSYIAALDCHEYGHGKLGLDCANAIYDGLAALHTTGGCDAVSAAAGAKFQELLDQCSAREVAYDAETMHGATMGAVFPP